MANADAAARRFREISYYRCSSPFLDDRRLPTTCSTDVTGGAAARAFSLVEVKLLVFTAEPGNSAHQHRPAPAGQSGARPVVQRRRRARLDVGRPFGLRPARRPVRSGNLAAAWLCAGEPRYQPGGAAWKPRAPRRDCVLGDPVRGRGVRRAVLTPVATLITADSAALLIASGFSFEVRAIGRRFHQLTIRCARRHVDVTLRDPPPLRVPVPDRVDRGLPRLPD